MPLRESSELSRVLKCTLEFSRSCWSESLSGEVGAFSRELDLRWLDNQVLDFFWQQWIGVVWVSLARLIGKWYSLTEQFHSHQTSRKARLHFKFSRWLCSIGEISRGSLAVNRCESNLTTRATLLHWSLFHQLRVNYSHHRRMFDFSIYASKIITSRWMENGKSPRAISESSSDREMKLSNSPKVIQRHCVNLQMTRVSSFAEWVVDLCENVATERIKTVNKSYFWKWLWLFAKGL